MPMSEFQLTGLTGREYKMLLDPEHFEAKPKQAGGVIWSMLPAIFEPHRTGDEPFPALPDDKERKVQFRDTDKLVLRSQGFSLRLRGKNALDEVTLKLRTSDIFVSGTTSLPRTLPPALGDGEEGDAKFEEDIAPLEVQTDDEGVVVPGSPGTRSRFSRSTTREKDEEYVVERLSDVVALFPTLQASLDEAGVSVALKARMNPGPEIDEHVFEAKGIPLKDQFRIKLALTLWYFDRANPKAAQKPLGMVELSFQWDLPDKIETDEEAERKFRMQSRRAERLFVDMQTALRDVIDRKNSSKTEQALPDPR